MYGLVKTGQFKKDVKKCKKRNYNLSNLLTALQVLEETGTLPFTPYKTHFLENKKIWDGHIEPDWVLLWQIRESDSNEFDGLVVLVSTGTHSDLFGK